VIVEDCSTSWSSDDDERSTTSSLDKMDGDAPSDANDDYVTSTLGDDYDDGSCLDDGHCYYKLIHYITFFHVTR